MRGRSDINARMNLPVTAHQGVMLLSGYDRGEPGVAGAWLKLPLEGSRGFRGDGPLRLAAKQKQPVQRALFDREPG